MTTYQGLRMAGRTLAVLIVASLGSVPGWWIGSLLTDMWLLRIFCAAICALLARYLFVAAPIIWPEGGPLPLRISMPARRLNAELVASRLALRRVPAKRTKEIVEIAREAARDAARDATAAGWYEEAREVVALRATCKGPDHVQAGWSRILEAAREGMSEGEALKQTPIAPTEH